MQTFDWDTVFVIDVNRVNAALAAHGDNLLMQFDASLGEEMNVSAAGRFRVWEVVKGGAAKILYIQMPILEGTLTVGENPFASILKEVPDTSKVIGAELLGEALAGGGRAVDLAGVSVVMAVSLHLLPRFDGPAPASDSQDLKFDIRGVGSGTPAPGLVTPVNVIDPAGRLTQADKGLLLATLAQYFVTNASRISYIFATINLVPPSSNSWLAPVASDYAYLDKVGVGSYLAVLSVVEGRDISGLSRSIDPAAIEPGLTGSYLISRGLFLRRVIQPYLPAAYHTGAGSFTYDAGTQTLRNAHVFQTASVKVGAITYYPNIRTLSVATTSEGLSTHVEGDCSLYAGISMKFTVRTKNRVTFDPSTKTISFLPDPKPESSHDASIPWYFWFLGFIAYGITELVVKLISDGVASALDQLASQALTIARNPPQSIQWEGATALNVTTAGVNESFYMMGQL